MADPKPNRFEVDLEEFIASLARIFVHRGNPAAVAVLSEGDVSCVNMGQVDEYDYRLDYQVRLDVPPAVFNSVIDRISKLEGELEQEAVILMRRYPEILLRSIVICPKYVTDPYWRTKAKAWLRGEGVNNQGRVRSDNIAPYTKDFAALDDNEVGFNPSVGIAPPNKYWQRSESDSPSL